MVLPVNSTLHGGQYKIVRFISAGGFGCTYEAYDTLMETRVAKSDKGWIYVTLEYDTQKNKIVETCK